MNGIWDLKADTVEKGDNLRDVTHIIKKTYKDNKGFTHFIFSKTMFKNQRYFIPANDFKLFQKFIDGGSREYPSDGNIPTDLVASEARIILKEIVKLSKNPNTPYHKEAVAALGNGKFGLIRGTVKLYLGKYTSRDWRRKRFTDDIDFWIYKVDLLEYSLKNNGWVKNKITREWEKLVYWDNPLTLKKEEHVLIASNDINQALDFGGGEYLEGTRLKDIFKKKLKRGHDVDLSDIINVAIVNNKERGELHEDWINVWSAFEESANTRSSRITSNIISLCRFSHGIADYLERIGRVIGKYSKLVLEESKYSDRKIIHVCKVSSHYLRQSSTFKPKITRNRIYSNLAKQKTKKQEYANSLRNFTNKVLDLLNSKYQHSGVIFEIENFEKKIPKVIWH